jgi:putative membrane protein
METMRSALVASLVIAAMASLDAHAQSTGPQGSTGHPATNQATPMQQLPSGTNPGSAAAAMSDRDFAMAAAIANKFEVIEGQLALRQASDPRLREFAQLMIKDHGAALESLQVAARSGNVALPAEIAPDDRHQAKINAIKNRKDADFDQAYRNDQVQAHQEAIALLDTYATRGGNAALKAWAAKTLAVVRKHQQHLQSMGMGSGSR